MSILGIVAEYDPFHNGHVRHLAQAREVVRPEETYIALSPCLKQRGSLSMLSPLDRARCALEAGADAVFALPVLWTVRDAEHYALGAVSMLAGLGATHLAFGAETDDLPLLRKVAETLEEPAENLRRTLRSRLDGGIGYPAAVSCALEEVLPEARGLLEKPNNILAVCYLRAVRRLKAPVEPVVIRREGDYRAETVQAASPSASALRSALRRGDYASALAAVPPGTARTLRQRFLEGAVPDERIADALLTARLRSMTGAEYTALPDLSEGMENLLRSASAAARSRQELLDALSGKRYPAARISRLCAYALLDASREELDSLPLPDKALLLGLRKETVKTARWKDLPLEVIPSFTEWKKTAHPADAAAWRLWAQCCGKPDTLPCSEKIIVV